MPKKDNMRKGMVYFLLAGLSVLLLFSCNKGAVYQKYINIPDDVWDMKNPVTFKVNIDDTINRYNIFVNVRNADNYVYSNLYLFIDIAFPSHKTERDTMECILADPISGHWLGQGLGDIWDNKIKYKANVVFPRKGEYTFTFTQAMREEKLPMVMDVGLTVEKADAIKMN